MGEQRLGSTAQPVLQQPPSQERGTWHGAPAAHPAGDRSLHLSQPSGTH